MVLHGLTFVGSLDLLLIGRWVAGVQTEEDERIGCIWQWGWCCVKTSTSNCVYSWRDWISRLISYPRYRRRKTRLKGECWSTCTCGKHRRHREDANEAHDDVLDFYPPSDRPE